MTWRRRRNRLQLEVSQRRLLRKNCPHCHRATAPNTIAHRANQSGVRTIVSHAIAKSATSRCIHRTPCLISAPTMSFPTTSINQIPPRKRSIRTWTMLIKANQRSISLVNSSVHAVISHGNLPIMERHSSATSANRMSSQTIWYVCGCKCDDATY